MLVVELDVLVAARGSPGRGLRSRLDPPAALLAVEDRGALEPEHTAEAVEHGRAGDDPASRGAPRLRHGRARLCRPPRGERDEALR